MSQWHQGKKETSNLNKSTGPKPKQITRNGFSRAPVLGYAPSTFSPSLSVLVEPT
jgi:hypothetical protein